MDLRTYLFEKRIKAKDAAVELGVSTSTLSLVKDGKNNPSLALARRIFRWSEGAVNYILLDESGAVVPVEGSGEGDAGEGSIADIAGGAV